MKSGPQSLLNICKLVFKLVFKLLQLEIQILTLVLQLFVFLGEDVNAVGELFGVVAQRVHVVHGLSVVLVQGEILSCCCSSEETSQVVAAVADGCTEALREIDFFTSHRVDVVEREQHGLALVGPRQTHVLVHLEQDGVGSYEQRAHVVPGHQRVDRLLSGHDAALVLRVQDHLHSLGVEEHLPEHVELGVSLGALLVVVVDHELHALEEHNAVEHAEQQ